MNDREYNEDDKRLFDKIKKDAKDEHWIYTPELFKKDVQEFHQKIREAYQVHDQIETRIHINTGDVDKDDTVKINDTFWAWEHVSGYLIKAYYATLRHKP